MSDDWSLTGLKQKKIDYVDKSIDIPYEIYHAASIETLRQKLIEDFTDIGMPPMPKEIVEEIINKRFGYNE